MSNCFVCVKPDQVAAVEFLGKFQAILEPGLSFAGIDICGMCVNIKYKSSRVQEKRCRCETKTKDNVFVQVVVAVQYEVKIECAQDAFYKLSNADTQIEAYVNNVVRAEVPKMLLDNVFESKDDIATAVQRELESAMTYFGYKIHNALVIDIQPDGQVKASMNEINANRRLRVAAAEKAEADKIITVKHSEAEAESKFLHGDGLAKQRQVIIDGLKQSIGGDNAHLTPDRVSELLIISQYFDALSKMADNPGQTIFTPAPLTTFDDMRSAFLQAGSGAPAAGGRMR